MIDSRLAIRLLTRFTQEAEAQTAAASAGRNAEHALRRKALSDILSPTHLEKCINDFLQSSPNQTPMALGADHRLSFSVRLDSNDTHGQVPCENIYQGLLETEDFVTPIATFLLTNGFDPKTVGLTLKRSGGVLFLQISLPIAEEVRRQAMNMLHR